MADMDERVDQWLRDAHAMEKQAEQMLSGQESRIESYPEIKERSAQHLEETRRQREKLEQCMERREIASSGMKDVAGQFSAMMQSVGSMMAGDEVMKYVLAWYAFEHFEIASYRILAAGAEAAGDSETARVCEEICKEEEATADWLAERMPQMTRDYLVREEGALDEASR